MRPKKAAATTRVDRFKPPIASAKLAPPRSRLDPIARSRLLLTEQALPRLTLLRAPAGFGKTTLMQQWFDQLAARDTGVAWVTLDPADNSVARLGDHLDEALARIPLRESKRHLCTTAIDPLDAFTLRLEQVERPLVVFLDEIEIISSNQVIHFLQALVRLTNQRFGLVIAGRSLPPLGQARMFLTGDVVELTEEALKFTVSEASALLVARGGAGVAAGYAAELSGQLDGWAAGLQFACLALRDHTDPGSLLKHAASRGPVSDYLRENVFNALPPDLRDFLLATSPFSTLTAGLCDAVTGRSDGAAMLALLERDGLFLKRVEIANDVVGYRFHDVFAGFLKGQLALQGLVRDQALHRAASQWYAKNKEWLEAVDHALIAGDRDAALAMLDAVSMDYVGWGQYQAFLAWNGRMTDAEAQQYPHAFSSWLWAEMFAGNNTLVAAAAVRFRGNLEAACAFTRELRDSLLSLEIVNAGAAEHFQEVRVLGTEALPRMSRPNSWEATSIANTLALAQLSAGDHREALRTLEIAKRSARSSDRSLNHVYTQIAHGMIHLSELRLMDATAVVREAFKRTTLERGNHSHATSLCASFLCEVLYEADQIDEAQRVCDGRIVSVTETGYPECILSINLTAARIATLRGDAIMAQAILAQAQAITARRELPRLFRTLQWERAHVAMACGNTEDALRFAAECATSTLDDDMPPSEAMTRDIAPIKLALSTGKTVGLTDRIARLLAQAKRLGLRRRWLKLLVLNATAMAIEGRREAALAEMIRALKVGLPAGFVRTFVDEGEPAVALIRDAEPHLLGTNRSYVEYLSRIHRATGAIPPVAPGSRVDRTGDPRQQLSTRELAIIDIATRGLTNLEIGRCLSISERTVKWHLQNVYHKLGVSNRTEAIFMTR